MATKKIKKIQVLDNGKEVTTATEEWTAENTAPNSFLFTGWKTNMRPHFSFTSKLIRGIMSRIEELNNTENLSEHLTGFKEIYVGNFNDIPVINSELLLELVTKSFLEKFNVTIPETIRPDVSKVKQKVMDIKSVIASMDKKQIDKLYKINPELSNVLNGL